MSSHSSSSSTSSTEGSPFPWVLEHLLVYPGTYEIPLRTMYALNSSTQTKPYRQSIRPRTPSLSDGSSAESSPASPDFPLDPHQQFNTDNATDHFKSCLMTHISQLPSQPFSLPAAFITSFVRRCFTADLCQVDFTQSLTALDYLKDLETRRKRDLSHAMQRLGIDRAALDQTEDDLSATQPRLAGWVREMGVKERKMEALYTQMYIGLRRWVCISSLMLHHKPLLTGSDAYQRNAP